MAHLKKKKLTIILFIPKEYFCNSYLNLKTFMGYYLEYFKAVFFFVFLEGIFKGILM